MEEKECLMCNTYKLKIIELENSINELKEHLKKYTAPQRNKKYYESNKEELNKKNKEYQEKVSSDKRKEYARKAYLKKKEKVKSIENNN